MGIDEIYINLRLLLLPVIVIIGIEFVLIGLYYFLYYRNLQSEGKPWIQMKKLFLGALFIGYVVFVLELTMIGRGHSYFLQMNLDPFSSYMEAWNKYSLRDLQNCIFNIIMFIPMGIMLPLINRKFEVFKWLLLVVVSSTLFIETYQTLTGAGLFELDDIINNTLGGIMGYQLYRLVASIVHNKKVRMKSLLGNLAIPLVMGLSLIGINIVYAQQEFGNLAINSFTKWNMRDVHLTSSLQLSSAPAVAPVYKRIIKRDGVKALLQQKLGLTELNMKDDSGDGEVLLKDKSGMEYTFFQSNEGGWLLAENNYTPERTSFADKEQMLLKAKTIMADLGILPQNVDFTELEGGEFQWSPQNKVELNENYWTGELSLGLKQDGSIYLINNMLHESQFVKKVDILSPAEVYERIKNGQFPQLVRNAILKPDQLVIKKGDQLELTGIELSFIYDTKNFYQPIYRVSGVFNGDSNWFTLIQARRS
ncbi:VanZ family protein [Paenibacillus sp. N1-5-1-14]|uniref:VanZ family protein n=1 Tax=Paenibacillus radicibacter TaxID=2972488 RepID=UPI0021590379|nr:VanZ family protein [Paenibacillus radicibacter]MCR8642938.1 VanZ family protein [Paenibacillus radicibacter]